MEVPSLKIDMCFSTMRKHTEAQMEFTASLLHLALHCIPVVGFVLFCFPNNTGVWPAASSCGGLTSGHMKVWLGSRIRWMGTSER